MRKKKQYNWRKCWKIDNSASIEVYSDFVRVFGINFTIENLETVIEDKKRDLFYHKEVLKKWRKEFGKNK